MGHAQHSRVFNRHLNKRVWDTTTRRLYIAMKESRSLHDELGSCQSRRSEPIDIADQGDADATGRLRVLGWR